MIVPSENPFVFLRAYCVGLALRRSSAEWLKVIWCGINRHEFEQALGVGDGQWHAAVHGIAEWDTTERLHWTELMWHLVLPKAPFLTSVYRVVFFYHPTLCLSLTWTISLHTCQAGDRCFQTKAAGAMQARLSSDKTTFSSTFDSSSSLPEAGCKGCWSGGDLRLVVLEPILFFGKNTVSFW